MGRGQAGTYRYRVITVYVNFGCVTLGMHVGRGALKNPRLQILSGKKQRENSFVYFVITVPRHAYKVEKGSKTEACDVVSRPARRVNRLRDTYPSTLKPFLGRI
ncbi:hypothetical protein EVAR_49812_1 [Eumeta japonica]|uniref:Uncharacterized protein n=1 Tax=Eumeta variegata TaxID=151549 RepID=A0A4C1XP18_EUMVA|nr:hypothetical protein EVAR_49812_1 [Eumeta japonica]